MTGQPCAARWRKTISALIFGFLKDLHVRTTALNSRYIWLVITRCGSVMYAPIVTSIMSVRVSVRIIHGHWVLLLSTQHIMTWHVFLLWVIWSDQVETRYFLFCLSFLLSVSLIIKLRKILGTVLGMFNNLLYGVKPKCCDTCWVSTFHWNLVISTNFSNLWLLIWNLVAYPFNFSSSEWHFRSCKVLLHDTLKSKY